MSIDKRKEQQQYKVNISATRADFDALSDILAKAVKRFDVDLYPQDKDLPGRISLTEGTAFQFSRVKKALMQLSDGLKNEDRGIAINLGNVDLREGREDEPKEGWLEMMDRVTDVDVSDGQRLEGAGLPIRNLMDKEEMFTKSFHAEGDIGQQDVLSRANMRWMYAEALLGPEITAEKTKITQMRQLERIKDYPPKLNKEEKRRIKRLAKAYNFNRAYIVVLEVDDMSRHLTTSVRTSPGGWDNVVRELLAGSTILKHYIGKPPKNLGDLYIRIAAYASGRGFGMTNVAVMPFDISMMGKMPLVGKDDFMKIKENPLVLDIKKDKSGDRYPVKRNFMSFLVVGKGNYRPTGLIREAEVLGDDLVLPEL